MARFSWPRCVAAAVLAALTGCSGFDHRERPAWRTHAEEACLAHQPFAESAYIQPFHALDGPGICGLHHPFKVRGLAGGTVVLSATETLDCSMIPALDAWITDVLQPAAQARFGEPVVEIKTMGSYNCRGINNMSGANLSEHAFGNALDVGGFVLASGRELNIMRGWKSTDDQERAFLHEAHAGACGAFTTVLGPGSNVFHYNHFHLDLAMHGNSSRGLRRICKPEPETALPEAPKRDNLPDPPAIEEEMDVAAAPAPPPGFSGPGFRSAVALATPLAPVTRLDRPASPLSLAPLSSTGNAEVRPWATSSPRQDPRSAPTQAPAPEGSPADWDLTSSIAAPPQP